MENTILFGFLLVLLLMNIQLVRGSCPSDTTVRITQPETLPPLTTPLPKLDCSKSGIDAATVTQDGKTYFFKGDYYWRVPRFGSVSAEYPRLIGQDWGGLPGDLDAATTLEDGRTFMFKGSRFWLFYNRTMMPGYPQPIKDGFCGIPININAAFVWSVNGQLYFFKGPHYWRFDGGEKQIPVKSQYPQNITDGWKDMPSPVDAVLRWVNGRTYFFYQDQYWRYDDYGPAKNPGRPYPRPIGKEWGGSCQDLKSRLKS